MAFKKNVKPEELYYVVHPLDDAPELKRDPAGMGLMPMTLSARISLGALQCYLIIMGVLVLYHVLCLAGLF